MMMNVKQSRIFARRVTKPGKIGRTEQSGFTLIEIMVVVVIIGMLATMILPNVLGQQDKALIARAKSDIRAISSALKLYKLDNFKYPAALSELTVGNNRYLDRVPRDPWDKEYQYSPGGANGDFNLCASGPGDGKQVCNHNMDTMK